MTTNIEVSPDDVKKCLNFAWQICKSDSQASNDFGRGDLLRSFGDRVADCAEGKIAECALGQFALDHFETKIGFDFSIYSDKQITDYGQDIDFIVKNGSKFKCSSKVDVKATRMGSQWLLIERHKFLADAFVLVRVDFPHDIEHNMETLKGISGQKINAEVVGFAYYFDMIDRLAKEPLIRFRKGDKLYKPLMYEKLGKDVEITASLLKSKFDSYNVDGDVKHVGFPLKAKDNFALPVCLLRREENEWKKFFDLIGKSSFEKIKEGNDTQGS